MPAFAETSRHACRRPRRRAFTLVEVLVTMSFLAIILPPVMTGISLSLSTGSLAKQQAEASSLAYSKMTELLAAAQWQQTSFSGDFQPDQPDYRWTAQVSDWDGTATRQLDVTVTWRHHGRDRNVTLSTLVYTGASS